jgi:hypothetical protein
MVDEIAMKRHQAEIVKILTPYLMAMPQSKINAGSLVVYARALSVLNTAEIDAAMLKLMRTMKFFPTVAEIFEQVEDVKRFASKTEVPSADEAWHEAMNLSKARGLYAKWEYSSEEVRKAVEHFGRREICVLEEKDVNVARAQFMRIYETVLRRGQNRQANASVLHTLPKKQIDKLIENLTDKMAVLEHKPEDDPEEESQRKAVI